MAVAWRATAWEIAGGNPPIRISEYGFSANCRYIGRYLVTRTVPDENWVDHEECLCPTHREWHHMGGDDPAFDTLAEAQAAVEAYLNGVPE